MGQAIALGLIAVSGLIIFAKPSKRSGKEDSTDRPSWANDDMVDKSVDGKTNARRMMDDKWKGELGKQSQKT